MIFLVSTHAAERYQERIRPGLDVAAAGDELHRMLNTVAQPVPTRPAWVFDYRPTGGPSDAWFMIGPDIAVPCARRNPGVYRAITVLHRAYHSQRRAA